MSFGLRTVPLTTGIEVLSHLIRPMAPLVGLGALAAVGLVAVVRDRRERRATRAFLLGFLAFSLLAVSARLYWRNHYFILALPAAAILAGIGVAALRRWLGIRPPDQQVNRGSDRDFSAIGRELPPDNRIGIVRIADDTANDEIILF